MKFPALLSVVIMGSLAVPAAAQDNRDKSQDFNGLYIGAVGGYTAQPNDGGEVLVFDTNRDGTFGDRVNTVGNTDAFSPGFCGGSPTSSANTSCRNDKDGFEYFGRVGYDKRMGNFVLGAVIEGGRSEATDSVTGFSTTPANYSLTRKAQYQANARLRAGYTPGGGVLFYATGGGAYARLNNSFTTTNGANSFADNGKTNAWGYSAGGGAEAMVTNNVSLGLEYLYTSLKDDDYVVNVGPGTAGPTNPFLLNGGGTDIKRGDDKMKTHSVRATLNFRF
jgi:outer membrane immunogenic protein